MGIVLKIFLLLLVLSIYFEVDKFIKTIKLFLCLHESFYVYRYSINFCLLLNSISSFFGVCIFCSEEEEKKKINIYNYFSIYPIRNLNNLSYNL